MTGTKKPAVFAAGLNDKYQPRLLERAAASLGVPKRLDDRHPAANFLGAVVGFRHIRGDLSLGDERAEIVADKAAEGELALLKAALAGAHIPRAVGDSAGFKLAELSGCREVQVEPLGTGLGRA